MRTDPGLLATRRPGRAARAQAFPPLIWPMSLLDNRDKLSARMNSRSHSTEFRHFSRKILAFSSDSSNPGVHDETILLSNSSKRPSFIVATSTLIFRDFVELESALRTAYDRRHDRFRWNYRRYCLETIHFKQVKLSLKGPALKISSFSRLNLVVATASCGCAL